MPKGASGMGERCGVATGRGASVAFVRLGGGGIA